MVVSLLFFTGYLSFPNKASAACAAGKCSGNGVSCYVIGETKARGDTNFRWACCDNQAQCDAEKALDDCVETRGGVHDKTCSVIIFGSEEEISTTKTYYCISQMSCEILKTKIHNSNNQQPPVTVCTYAGDKESACNACLDKKGIWTALGCIPFNQDEFIVSVVKIIMGVAGFITLAMMLVATIMLMTGGGNQEQIKRGKEIFTGAVVGLLFLIFSVVILQIITKDIIKLDISTPGPVNHGPKPIEAR